VAALADPRSTRPDQLERLVVAAHGRGIDLAVHSAAAREQIAPAIGAARAATAEALIVLASALFVAHRALIIEHTAALQLPTMYQWAEYPAQGALISYGPRRGALFRQAAALLAKVLAGAKPTELPVQQPARFELGINLKTAAALGLAVPPALLDRADELIE
jgi:putative ABC transport system substrate-binding protein